MDASSFSRILWGNYYFNKASKKVSKKPEAGAEERTFVSFILNPLYKILGYSVSYEKETLEPILKNLGVYLKKEHWKLDTKSLLKIVCLLFFGDSRTFVDMVVNHIPDPGAATCHLVNRCYKGFENSEIKK